RLGAASSQAPLLLLRTRSGDEDRHASGNAVADRQRPGRLELEEWRASRSCDPVELGPQRSRAVALAPREVDVLEELALAEAPVELLPRDEPIVAAVDLAGAAIARRRRDREL